MRITENYELSCGGRAQSSDAFQELKTNYLWQGQWVFAACVFDAASKKIRMYVNGTEATNMTTTWTANTIVDAGATTTKDAIGGLPNSGDNRSFKGAIDQLKLHNKVLSQSEITTLYQEGGGTTCTPATSCSTGAVCGTQPNGCGGLVNCGTCSAGQTCTSSNTCVSSCTPKTCQNVGAGGTAVQCGAPSDGCGGTLACGTCTTGNVCNASFQCAAACTPTTCAASGKNCGTMSDGCSATLNCGSCSSGNVCTNNVCTAGTGGACAGIQTWDANTPWTDYAAAAPYSQRQWKSRKYECTNRGYCYYEPGTTYGNYGWTDKGGC
jgi:hypothetical protein